VSDAELLSLTELTVQVQLELLAGQACHPQRRQGLAASAEQHRQGPEGLINPSQPIRVFNQS
jgi:hypothetical protein